MKVKGMIRLALLLVLSFTVAVPGGFAKKEGKNPSGWSKGEKKGWKGESIPPGWVHGKKTGWKEKGVPPGFEKKEEDGEDEEEEAGKKGKKDK